MNPDTEEIRSHKPFTEYLDCPHCRHKKALKLKETVTKISAASPKIFYIGHVGECLFCLQKIQLYKIVSDHFRRAGNVFIPLPDEPGQEPPLGRGLI